MNIIRFEVCFQDVKRLIWATFETGGNETSGGFERHLFGDGLKDEEKSGLGHFGVVQE